MWKFYLLHNSLLKSHYKHEKSVENNLNAFFIPLLTYSQDAPIMIRRMNRTTSNAKPPPKFPFTPDMKYPPFV